MRRLSLATLVLVVSISLCAVVPASAVQRPSFEKVDYYIHRGDDDTEEKDAQLILDPQQRVVVFADEDNAAVRYAALEFDRIETITYEKSSHPRITAGLLVAWPLFFLKGKKHWLTITYGPGANGQPAGYLFARMDKDNYQAILAAINAYTGAEVRRIDEDKGEVTILYPGRRAPPAPSPAPQRPSSSPGDPSSMRTVAAAPPPAANASASSSAVVPAAPPPPATEALQDLILTEQAVGWTERRAQTVAYRWESVVENPNSVAVDAVLRIRLLGTEDEVLYEEARGVSLGGNQRLEFTHEGAVPDAAAEAGQRWMIDAPDLRVRETVAGDTGQPLQGVQASSANPHAAAPPLNEPLPLTPDMSPPVLVSDSVKIELENAELQRLNVTSKKITIRCLVAADGRVEGAKVYRVDPPVTLDAARESLYRSIEDSAVRFWRFEPALKDGQPVRVWHMVTIDFDPPRH